MMNSCDKIEGGHRSKGGEKCLLFDSGSELLL